MVIPVRRNKKNLFTIARIHYSLDPDKYTKEWLNEAKRGMPEMGFKREYEIDYSFYAGKQFFTEFREYNIAKESIDYRPREILYRGWDYGFHRPCCVITMLNGEDQWCILKVILGKDEYIYDFGRRVKDYCQSTYPSAKYIDVDDIAGIQVSDKTHQTSRQALNNLGIFPSGSKQEIEEGVTIIRKKLRIRVDGLPGLIIDPNQHDVIDGFKGGIHYPNVKEGQPQREEYEKDGYYEHIFDPTRYLAVQMFTLTGEKESQNEIARDPLQWAMRDGRPRRTLDANEIDMTSDDISDSLGGGLGEEII